MAKRASTSELQSKTVPGMTIVLTNGSLDWAYPTANDADVALFI